MKVVETSVTTAGTLDVVMLGLMTVDVVGTVEVALETELEEVLEELVLEVEEEEAPVEEDDEEVEAEAEVVSGVVDGIGGVEVESGDVIDVEVLDGGVLLD